MPSISSSKHIVRFVSILAYLQAHPGTTLRELAKAFDTDVRGMRRTLTTLVGYYSGRSWPRLQSVLGIDSRGHSLRPG